MENILETFVPFKTGQTLFILMEECLFLKEALFKIYVVFFHNKLLEKRHFRVKKYSKKDPNKVYDLYSYLLSFKFLHNEKISSTAGFIPNSVIRLFSIFLPFQFFSKNIAQWAPGIGY
jgi:hypothetical protein